MFGSGIPLFGPGTDQATLKLTETKVYKCGIVFLAYDVVRSNVDEPG